MNLNLDWNCWLYIRFNYLVNSIVNVYVNKLLVLLVNYIVNVSFWNVVLILIVLIEFYDYKLLLIDDILFFVVLNNLLNW